MASASRATVLRSVSVRRATALLADAFTESGDDLNLLVAGQDIHAGPIRHVVEGLVRAMEKSAAQCYMHNGRKLRGPIPRWTTRARRGCNAAGPLMMRGARFELGVSVM